MLTYIQINAAKAAAKPYLLRDGQGLYLQIKPNGSKLWRMNYRYLDKQKSLHLGKWPGVGLADARAKRDEAKQKVAAGFDPAVEKKRARIAAKYAAANTFELVAKEWLVKCERDGHSPDRAQASGECPSCDQAGRTARLSAQPICHHQLFDDNMRDRRRKRGVSHITG